MPANRLIIKAVLRPALSARFQPTGFPELGPAEFRSSDGTLSLLVESPQSMANRLEEVIWDSAKEDLIAPLQGMPYVRLARPGQGQVSSITEPHRIASPYLLPHLKDRLIEELGWDQKRRLAPHEIAPVLLRRDPNSLVHGVYFATLKPGNLKLPRLLSAFIEARDVNLAISGGAKLDHHDSQAPREQGKGNVLYSRTEYVSSDITAVFSLDLVQLRRYSLSPEAESFLKTLALYKIRLFLDHGMRLRTACDFDLAGQLQVEPNDVGVPDQEKFCSALAPLIEKLRKSGEFSEPSIWEL